MKKPRLKLELWKKKGQLLSTGSIDIDDYISLTMTNSYIMKDDSFSIQIPIHKVKTDTGTWDFSTTKYYGDETNTENTPIKAEDRIRIYAWNEGDAGSTFIMDGRVTVVNFKKNEKMSVMEVKGGNNTEMMLQTMAPTTYPTGSTLTSPEMIFSIIGRVNRFNGVYPYATTTDRATSEATPNNKNLDRKIYADYISNGGYVAEEDSNGNAFPSSNPYTSPYRNAFQLIQVISGTKYTEDNDAGEYIFWVDETNSLHWNPRTPFSTTTGSTIDENDYNLSVSKDAKAIVNAMRISTGRDAKGQGIAFSLYNAESGTKNGWRWKYEPDVTSARELLKEETQYGPINNASGSIHTDGFPSAYPWTMNFIEVSDVRPYEDVDTSKQVVANDDAYNVAIRNRSKRKSYDKYKPILDILATAKYRASINPEYGEAAWYSNLGEVYSFTIESYGERFKGYILMRLKQITSNFSKNGWGMDITYEQDEKTYQLSGE